MKITLRNVVVLMLVAILAGCEYLPFSQGPLQGTVVSIPESWAGIASEDVIQFETTGDAPYSVNLWVLEIDGDLHVFAGDNLSTWVEHILAGNDQVRLGVKGSIYELQAARVTDAQIFEQFAQGWEEKYGNRPRNENVSETYLFRLTPRS